MNTLFFGDNLPILTNRDLIDKESVDLIYLDPPFNSAANYNVIFKEVNEDRSAVQIRAFTDTWKWGGESQSLYQDLTLRSDALGTLIEALFKFLGTSDTMAYLVMMAPRLVALRRVLKPTGSIYLHCDPTASHYLKLVMDAIFGVEHYRNELVWLRATPRGHAFTRFASTHDVILSYTKGDFPDME